MIVTRLHILIAVLLLLATGGLFFYQNNFSGPEAEPSAPTLLSEPIAAPQVEERQVATIVNSALEKQSVQVFSPTHHRVKRGETLWAISKRKEYFGVGHRWYDIWKANETKIPDFDRLTIGLSLVVPLEKPENYAWPKTTEEAKAEILKNARFFIHRQMKRHPSLSI